MTRHPYGEMFEGEGRRVGREGIRAWFREWYEAFEDFEHRCDELIDAGDLVVSVGTDRARGRESGARVERHLAGAWTVRDGQVVRVAWFPSREAALEAAGHSE
jgi:ketosteroid isomerase-like protein